MPSSVVNTERSTRSEIANIFGNDQVLLSTEARGAAKASMDFSVDFGYRQAVITGQESPAVKHFMRALVEPQGNQMVVPVELQQLDVAIAQLLRAGMNADKRAVIESNTTASSMPSKGLRAFMAQQRDPMLLVQTLAKPFVAPVDMNGSRFATGFTLLAGDLPGWTAQKLEAFCADLAHDVVRTRISEWADTMNMQNFESEMDRVKSEYGDVLQKKEADLWRLQKQLRETDDVAQKKAIEATIAKVQRSLANSRDSFAEMDDALPQLKLHDRYKKEQLGQLTEMKLMETLFMDFMARIVYGEGESNQNVAFLASDYCDSKGVDLYIASPDGPQEYLAIDLTTSENEYYKKVERYHEMGDRNYNFENFRRFVRGYESFANELDIQPHDSRGDAFVYRPDRVKKDVVYIDRTLWNGLLDHMVMSVQQGTYEKDGMLDIDALNQVFQRQKQKVPGPRVWKESESIRSYLRDLLADPRRFLPPRF